MRQHHLRQKVEMRLQGLIIAMALPVLLAACQMVLPGRDGVAIDAGAASPVVGDAIAVTSLDAPPDAATTDAAVTDLATPGAAVTATGPRPKPRPGADVGAVEPTEAEVAPPEPPPVAKTAEQLACEKKGGKWSSVGKTGKTCVKQTRDAGKQCTKAGDCDGYCLARSRSCAPVTPLFGCNEVLQDNGRQVTVCLD